MIARSLCLANLLICATSPALLAGEETTAWLDVRILEDNDTHAVRIGNQLFTVLNRSTDLPKPFFLPVYAPNGVDITRPLNDPEDRDHPHHKGIWISVDEVNGTKYWNEDGKIVNLGTKVETAVGRNGNPAVLVTRNRWQDADGNAALIEETTWSFYPDSMIVVEIELQPAGENVVLDDTKEGLFAFRMAKSMKEKETGTVTGADGTEGAKSNWGTTQKWIDYSGIVDEKQVGLAIFDHPENFRPSRYHVRNYGLFSINPFGEKAYTGGKNEAAPVTLAAGEKLNLTYGMLVHTGDVKKGHVANMYDRFLKRTAATAESVDE